MRTATPSLGDEHLELRPRDFEQIRKLAYDSFGLDLKPGKEEMVAARLRRLIQNRGYGSFQRFCRSVVQDATGESLAALIDALATNHTSFHREADHFEFLRREGHSIFGPANPIEIWSAGCATGEEVWTLLFLLNDLFAGRAARVIGTDVSRKALAGAVRGLYTAEKCAVIPPAWKSKYCVAGGPDGSAIGLRPEIRAMAEFRRLNLMEPFSWPRRFRVIFCRNVMIYFNPRTQEEVAQKLADCLEPGGYLFIGHAESLARCGAALEYVQPAIYRRPIKGDKGWSRSS